MPVMISPLLASLFFENFCSNTCSTLLPPPPTTCPANSKSRNSRAPRYLACSNWGFKPDVHTSLGINGGNKWKLKATIYSRKAVLGWGESP